MKLLEFNIRADERLVKEKVFYEKEKLEIYTGRKWLEQSSAKIALDLRTDKDHSLCVGYETADGWILSDRKENRDEELSTARRAWELFIADKGLYKGPRTRSKVHLAKPIAKVGRYTLTLASFAGYSAHDDWFAARWNRPEENEDLVLYPEKSEVVQGYLYYDGGYKFSLSKEGEGHPHSTKYYPVTARVVKKGQRGRIGHILEQGKKVPLYAVVDFGNKEYVEDIYIENWPKELEKEVEEYKASLQEKASSSSHPTGFGWGHGKVDW